MADIEREFDDEQAIDFDDYDNAEDGSASSDFEDESDTDEAEPDEQPEVEELPIEWGIDFKTGRLTGGKVQGLEAIKVWAWNVLHIPRYDFAQFTWDCGSELKTLIGEVESEPLVRSDMQRMITECLTQNKYIEGVDNFTCSLEGDVVKAAFTISTTFGEVDMNVAIQ